jgi:hypothetical protein
MPYPNIGEIVRLPPLEDSPSTVSTLKERQIEQICRDCPLNKPSQRAIDLCTQAIGTSHCRLLLSSPIA